MSNYDQAADDDFDFVIENSSGHDKSQEELAAESEYPTIPAGTHTLMVKGLAAKPDYRPFEVWYDGERYPYNAHTFRVLFCLPDNPTVTVEDNFQCPPIDPSDNPAYFYGKPIDPNTGRPAIDKRGQEKNGGFAAKKYYNFLSGLGFDYVKGESIPPEATDTRNWKGRFIEVTVIDREYNGKTYKNIKLMSYKRVDQEDAAAAAGLTTATQSKSSGQPVSKPRASTAPAATKARPPAVPVGAGYGDGEDNGLDNI